MRTQHAPSTRTGRIRRRGVPPPRPHHHDSPPLGGARDHAPRKRTRRPIYGRRASPVPGEAQEEEPSVSVRRITIFDTTLRDGEQSPGIALAPDEKAEIADAARAPRCRRDRGGLRRLVPRRLRRRAGSRARGRAHRPSRRSAERGRRTSTPRPRRSPDARRSRLHVFIATSPIHMEKKLRLEPAEVVEQARWAVGYAAGSRRRGRVLLRGRHPQRPALRGPGLPRGHRGRRDHDQPSRHGRLLPARGARGVPPRGAAPLPRAPRGLASPSTATTTWGSPSRTRSPACRPGATQIECTRERARRAGRERGARGGRDGARRASLGLRGRNRRRPE